MSRAALEKFVRTCIDMPVDSVQSLDLHGVLVARHGKLVLEEYFHGENRDKPHDTRSASKVVADVLAGAVMQSGVRFSDQSKVYAMMNGGAMPAGLDARKQAMTLENLLTMSSGLDIDDNDDNSKGNEDRVADAGVKDVWAYTLALDMVRDPGTAAIYGSLQPNLVGGVTRAAAGRPLVDLFHDLIATPMRIDRYWFGLMGTGEPYLGGGARFLPRDFMKFGQLMLNGGTWNGHRVLSREWAVRSTSHVVDIDGKSPYGYLWWMTSTPYQGRRVSGYAALGNGGQNVIVIPELDLVIAFYCGNYNAKTASKPINHLLPEFILPAITSK
jgi:CubicO group peptidase (beta-lactamase class C family)